ncbi:MAG: hypothetical protein AAGE84_18755 [Cyanobacteria bacterium P01_G01_bin.39]
MPSLSVEQFANIGVLKINYIGEALNTANLRRRIECRFLMLLSMKTTHVFAEGVASVSS